jgi:hypothetical protein
MLSHSGSQQPASNRSTALSTMNPSGPADRTNPNLGSSAPKAAAVTLSLQSSDGLLCNELIPSARLSRTPARNHFWMSRRMRLSPIRCSRKRTARPFLGGEERPDIGVQYEMAGVGTWEHEIEHEDVIIGWSDVRVTYDRIGR